VLAYGTLSIAMTASNDSPPPIIANLVSGHKQIVKFDCSSGRSSIDIKKAFAKKVLGELLQTEELFGW
jgi:hypothetical protein